MSNFTEKNENRKNHKGGNRQHIEARKMRRLLGGPFGVPTIAQLKSWSVNDLQTGTSAKPIKGGDEVKA